ncbi:MAG: chemotaxis protein CheW [Myxococcota bacterium]
MNETSRTTDVQRVLAGRALKLAHKTEQRRDASFGVFVVTAVGSWRVGLPHAWLSGLTRRPAITPLPNLPPWMPGVAVVRGHIVSVIDLARLAGESRNATADVLAVVNGAAGDLGLLVDDVLDFRDIETDEVVQGEADPAAGIGLPTLGTTRSLVVLLDVARLFSDERVVVNRSEGAPGVALSQPPRVERS